MQIKTYGRTAEINVTDAEIRATQRLITTVRKQRTTGLANFICTWAEAREIAERVEARDVVNTIAAKACRMGRIRRAKVRLAA